VQCPERHGKTGGKFLDFLFPKKKYISIYPESIIGTDVKSFKTIVLFLIAFSLAFINETHAQWEWLNPNPESNEFFSAGAPSNGTAWFVGENGSIVYTTNLGVDWVAVDNPLRGTPFLCLSVVLIDAQTILLSANNGTILRSYDAGNSWEILPPPSVSIQKMKQDSDGTVWGFGSNGSIARSSDVGSSWESFNTGVVTVVYDLEFPETGTVIAACGQGTMLRSTDDGSTWVKSVPNSAQDLLSIAFIDSQKGFMLQRAKVLINTTDGGTTWNDTLFSTDEMRRIRFFDENVGWIVTNSIGNVYKTIDGGMSWTLITIDPTTKYTFQDIVPLSQTDALAYGEGGGVFVTNDGGQNWQQLGSGISREHMHSVTGISNQEAWVFGNQSAYQSTDAGSTWTANMAPADPAFIIGHAISATRLVGCGSQGETFLSIDGGQNWTSVSTLTGAGRIEEIDFIDATTGWVVGAHGTIARTIDGGDSWEDKDPGVTHDFYGIHAVSASEAWVVGNGGKIYSTIDGGLSWQEKTSGTTANLRSIHFVSAQEAWAGGEFILLHSSDGGQTWVRENTSGIDVIYDIKFIDAQTGFFMASRSILRTNDGGATIYRTDYPASGLRAIHPLSDGHAWLAGDFGAILRYTPAPVVSVSPSYIDYGDVPTNRHSDKTFEIRSVGEVDLSVNNVVVSGRDNAFTFESGALTVLAPGSSITVTIRFAPPNTGDYQGIASVKSDAEMGFSIVDMVGKGIVPPPPAFSHDPDTLDFGEVRLSELKDLNVMIKNNSQKNILVNNVYTSGGDSSDFLISGPPGGFFPPDAEEAIGVSFVPRHMGTLMSNVIVFSNDGAEPYYPIPVRGVGMNPFISPESDTLNFGYVFITNPSTETLVINNTGNLPLLINSSEIVGRDSLDFSLIQAPAAMVPVGGNTEVRIQYTAAEPFGERIATLRMTTDDFFNYTKDVMIIARPTSTGIEDGDPILSGFSISQNYPNPFSASKHGMTSFSMTVPVQSDIEVSVYNTLGEKVKTMAKSHYNPGTYNIGLSANGLQPGLYLVEMRIDAGPAIRVRSILTK
jgi:photosystem II stability/assembly factor-like uncharacterized protein